MSVDSADGDGSQNRGSPPALRRQRDKPLLVAEPGSPLKATWTSAPSP